MFLIVIDAQVSSTEGRLYVVERAPTWFGALRCYARFMRRVRRKYQNRARHSFEIITLLPPAHTGMVPIKQP